MGFPLLQMCVGRQIKVLGSYWKGRMSNEESNSLYLCTVREYHALHKWDAGGTPSQAMELQEMGVDGQGEVYHVVGETIPRQNMYWVTVGHVDKH